MNLLDRTKLNFLPLSLRKSKSSIEKVIINPDSSVSYSENSRLIGKIADTIIIARENNKPVIMAYGAHLIKNGLGLVIKRMIEEGYITHLATNGAGSLHDWEFAFLGESEEDVRAYLELGQFGLWDETGKYINLALIAGAEKGKGYGESICEMVHKEELTIPQMKNEKLEIAGVKPGRIEIKHPFKEYSVQNAAFSNHIPLTVHPGFGYDIIYSHPLSDGASIGKCAEIDFLRFAESIRNLEGGVYISVGSSIMSPMIFEKSLSMARNLARQENKRIENFMIVVNDIQEGNWDWNKGEPPKDNPAYYLRFCKSFNRCNPKELYYLNENNREFLLSLYHSLKNKKT